VSGLCDRSWLTITTVIACACACADNLGFGIVPFADTFLSLEDAEARRDGNLVSGAHLIRTDHFQADDPDSGAPLTKPRRFVNVLRPTFSLTRCISRLVHKPRNALHGLFSTFPLPPPTCVTRYRFMNEPLCVCQKTPQWSFAPRGKVTGRQQRAASRSRPASCNLHNSIINQC